MYIMLFYLSLLLSVLFSLLLPLIKYLYSAAVDVVIRSIIIIFIIITITLIRMIELFRYLARVGLKRVMKLLGGDGNAELLENIISTLLISGNDKSTSDNYYGGLSAEKISEEKLNEISGLKTNEATTIDNKSYKEIEIIDWLQDFTTLNGFDLMIRFFSKPVITDVCTFLRESPHEEHANILMKYQLDPKPVL